VVKTISGRTVTTEEREIVPDEARIVARIFHVAGTSPKQIAKNLNREGVTGPFGGLGARARSTATPSAGPGF
jgi:hypothetical protein